MSHIMSHIKNIQHLLLTYRTLCCIIIMFNVIYKFSDFEHETYDYTFFALIITLEMFTLFNNSKQCEQ